MRTLPFLLLLVPLILACTPARPPEPDVTAPVAETYAEVVDLCHEREAEIHAWVEAVDEYKWKLAEKEKLDFYFVGPGKSALERRNELKRQLWENCRDAEADYWTITIEKKN